MLRKRIIPCLDIADGRTVKGVNFVDLRDAGDPVALARGYAAQGADELVLLDISASQDRRTTRLAWIEAVAREVNIPFTVGGGIDSVTAAYEALRAGADKVCVNSAAVRRPSLIDELAAQFGSQCVVLAIDARQDGDQWEVYTHGGRRPAGRQLIEWALEGEQRGAGEILFTSMDHDGTRQGYALSALKRLNAALRIPLIASGGAGNIGDFVALFEAGAADAALAASIFHFGQVSLPALKQALAQSGIPVRS